MIDRLPATIVVASVRPCEQYRYRVKLPATLGDKVRSDIRRQALNEINECFLDCTRTFQSVAWLGSSNISFADSRHSPSDSKSEFLHMLICLKVIDLSYRYHLENCSGGMKPPSFALEVEVTLSSSIRKGIMKLCEERGMELVRKPDLVAKTRGRVRIGGVYRSSQNDGTPFALQPIKYLESLRGVVTQLLPTLLGIRRCVNFFLRVCIFLFWPIPLAARGIFSFYYRAAAARVLNRLDGQKNVFVYFDLRLGRNRDIGAYLRWKYNTAFGSENVCGSSSIPFTHIARPDHAYSFGAMLWAYQVLKMMEKDPLSGCVVVNYLLPMSRLLEVRLLRGDQRCNVRRKLVEFERNSGDFFQQLIFKQFIASLDLTQSFPLEISTCYDLFFEALAPGVVVQADAVAKTARHFTACARRRGSRVIYVADRICTNLRTSNQFIIDNGDNPHLPDRCVVFDQVSKDEFIRQGMSEQNVHSYYRNFAADILEPAVAPVSGLKQVVILLQAYEDNIGGMVQLGEEIARKYPELLVIYQEHPNFPVCARVKSDLLKKWPGRLRFLAPRESVDYAKTLALVTGYSTAAVPGVLHGVPLIWLRRQIDNSIYGEAYLNRIGLVADKPEEVNSILKRLIRRDPEKLAACVAAAAEAKAIFTPPSALAARTLPEALAQAINASFVAIHAAPFQVHLSGIDASSGVNPFKCQ
jgi:hypothetical protein